jgi:hypothetical protein
VIAGIFYSGFLGKLTICRAELNSFGLQGSANTSFDVLLALEHLVEDIFMRLLHAKACIYRGYFFQAGVDITRSGEQLRISRCRSSSYESKGKAESLYNVHTKSPVEYYPIGGGYCPRDSLMSKKKMWNISF